MGSKCDFKSMHFWYKNNWFHLFLWARSLMMKGVERLLGHERLFEWIRYTDFLTISQILMEWCRVFSFTMYHGNIYQTWVSLSSQCTSTQAGRFGAMLDTWFKSSRNRLFSGWWIYPSQWCIELKYLILRYFHFKPASLKLSVVSHWPCSGIRVIAFSVINLGLIKGTARPPATLNTP